MIKYVYVLALLLPFTWVSSAKAKNSYINLQAWTIVINDDVCSINTFPTYSQGPMLADRAHFFQLVFVLNLNQYIIIFNPGIDAESSLYDAYLKIGDKEIKLKIYNNKIYSDTIEGNKEIISLMKKSPYMTLNITKQDKQLITDVYDLSNLQSAMHQSDSKCVENILLLHQE